MLNLSSICSISKCSLCTTDKSKARLGGLIFQDPSQLISLGIKLYNNFRQTPLFYLAGYVSNGET
jgi:hypothetical protein